jgi:nucleoside-diphosphate-sugar epimerase
MKQETIALTGSTGFIGRHLLMSLRQRGYRVRILLRQPLMDAPDADSAVIGDLARPLNLSKALEGIDIVVHTAGLAHAMSGRPEDDYRAINTAGTLRLAEAAYRMGARRFVFLSSVRAQSGPVAAGVLTEQGPIVPTDAYGRSKWEAEQGLAGLGMDFAALRPVLVYGAGVKGNMEQLMRLAALPFVLPLASLTARRSLLAVENLADAVASVVAAPGRLSQAFLVADDGPLTIPQMIGALRAGLDRRSGLLPCPPFLLSLAARLSGRIEVYERLSGSLVVDNSALKALGWMPRLQTVDGLARLARETRSPL